MIKRSCDNCKQTFKVKSGITVVKCQTCKAPFCSAKCKKLCKGLHKGCSGYPRYHYKPPYSDYPIIEEETIRHILYGENYEHARSYRVEMPDEFWYETPASDPERATEIMEKYYNKFPEHFKSFVDMEDFDNKEMFYVHVKFKNFIHFATWYDRDIKPDAEWVLMDLPDIRRMTALNLGKNEFILRVTIYEEDDKVMYDKFTKHTL